MRWCSASELGQKYATKNYPSQGTQICKLHGPRIKPFALSCYSLWKPKQFFPPRKITMSNLIKTKAWWAHLAQIKPFVPWRPRRRGFISVKVNRTQPRKCELHLRRRQGSPIEQKWFLWNNTVTFSRPLVEKRVVWWNRNHFWWWEPISITMQAHTTGFVITEL